MSVADPYCRVPVDREYREWLRNNSILFDGADAQASRRLSRFCKVSQCYANAARNARSGLEYYEGFVNTGLNGTGLVDFWFEHAFLVRESQMRVVDPTLALLYKMSDLARFCYIGRKFENAIQQMDDAGGRFDPLLRNEYARRSGRRGVGTRAWKCRRRPDRTGPKTKRPKRDD